MAEETNQGTGMGMIVGILLVLVIGVLVYMFAFRGGLGNPAPAGNGGTTNPGGEGTSIEVQQEGSLNGEAVMPDGGEVMPEGGGE